MQSQIEKLKNLLSDGKPHRTDEILEKVYGNKHLGIARIGARIYDLKKQGLQIICQVDSKIKTLYWYQCLNSSILIFKK